jgi:hypothetical protein
MKTAVEYFEFELKDKLGQIVINQNWKLLEEIIQKSKEMFEEQIKEAWFDGVTNWDSEKEVEDYLKETFKSE